MSRTSDNSDIEISEDTADAIEEIIFELVDEFHIRIKGKDTQQWQPTDPHLVFDGPENEESSLREIWPATKEKLSGLMGLLYNFLRRLDAQDLDNAARILRARDGTRRDLVVAILEFLANTLKKTVVAGEDESLRATPTEE